MSATLSRILLLAALLGLPACVIADESGNDSGDCPECISGEGTVRHSAVEGGFWYIEADDGRKFDPYGLPDGFAKDGLRVRFVVKPKPDRMGFHMMGTIVELVSIEALEGGPAER